MSNTLSQLTVDVNRPDRCRINFEVKFTFLNVFERTSSDLTTVPENLSGNDSSDQQGYIVSISRLTIQGEESSERLDSAKPE